MRLLGTCLLAAAIGSIGVASASEVSLRLVGENGPLGAPAYVVTLDNALVGAGALPAPEGPLPRERADLGAVATQLSFALPDGLLRADSVVKVYLINDSADANTGADTTLYILGVSVDGVAADVASATIATAEGEAKTIYLTPDGALILAWNAAASFTAPLGGWLQAANTDSESTTGPESTVAPAPTTEAPATEASPPVDAEAVAEVPAATDVLEPTCAVDATIALTDFANGEAYVTEKTAQELIGFLKEMSVDQCKLEVAGYSSLGGEPEINRAVSQARADAVLDFIKRRKLPFASEQAVGRGQTTEFGNAAANRRVVVTIGH
jgi:outer membrane protein OmpA-like peptidoglycan-associated protein